MTVDLFASWAVYPVFHPVGVVRQSLVFDGERHLSTGALAVIGRSRVLHALVFLRAMPALEKTAFKVHPGLAVLGFAGALVADGVACRTDAGQVYRIELELTGWDSVFPTGFGQILVAFAVLVLLILELRIAAPEFVVGHVAIDLALMQVFHIHFVGEAGVGGDDGALLVDVLGNTQFLEAGFHGFQHRLQGVVFLPFPEGLGIDNNLMFLVHRGHAVVALDRALAGGHLGAFVIGEVALHFLAPLPPAHPWAVRL